MICAALEREELRQLAPAIVSRWAGRRTLGYLRAQKERLLGQRGQLRVNRPELIEAHSYDSKYVMHAARIGHQDIELVGTGRLTLPIPEPSRSRVMAIRLGERSLEQAVAGVSSLR